MGLESAVIAPAPTLSPRKEKQKPEQHASQPSQQPERAQQPAQQMKKQSEQQPPQQQEKRDNSSSREKNSNAKHPQASTPVQSKKRKYEEATDEEKVLLNEYHIANPQLKQRELAEWFKNKFGKSVNQSTVSRNLKKFKNSPPSKTVSIASNEQSPKCSKHNTQAPPHKIHIKKAHQPHLQPQLQPRNNNKQNQALSGVSLPPTPPPRDHHRSPIDSALYEFYLNFRKLHPDASSSDCDREIKLEARKLISSIRPPPPPERIDDPIVDDVWVSNWKRACGILPTPPPSSNCFSALSGGPPLLPLPHTPITNNRHLVDTDISSEETEPRSPVSTVSSIENRSHELPPMRTSPPASAGLSTRPPGGGLVMLEKSRSLGSDAPESLRRTEIERLRMEVERRNKRIEHEVMKKESALRQLERLENML